MIHIKPGSMVEQFSKIIDNVCMDVSILSVICLVSLDLISYHWSLSEPSEHIRKVFIF